MTKQDSTEPPTNCKLFSIEFEQQRLAVFQHPAGFWKIPLKEIHINHAVITDRAMWLLGYWCGIEQQRLKKKTE